MKKTKEKPTIPITASDLVLNSKLGIAPERKKGVLYNEAMNLLFNKIGITQDELKTINLRSIRNNKQMARQFEEQIKKSKIDAKEVIKELSSYINFSDGFNTRELPAGSITIQVPDPERFQKIHLDGRGTPGVGDTMEFKASTVAYKVDFIPAVDGFFKFRFPFFAVGPYILIADDGPCNDKYAEIGINATVTITQHTATSDFEAGRLHVPIFYKRETNASIFDHIVFGQAVGYSVSFLQKNQPTSFVIDLRVFARVSGEGSIAEVNLGKGVGAAGGIVWFPWLDIAWIGQ